MACPLVNLQAYDVPIVTLDGVFVGVTTIAMYEHGLGGSAHSRFSGEQLGDGGGFCCGQTLVFEPGGAVDEQAGGLHVGGHVCQGRAYLLEIGDTLAELATLL